MGFRCLEDKNSALAGLLLGWRALPQETSIVRRRRLLTGSSYHRLRPPEQSDHGCGIMCVFGPAGGNHREE